MSPLFLIAFASVAAAAYFAVELVTAGGRDRRTAVRRAGTYGRVRRTALTGREQLRAPAMGPLKENLAKWVLRLTPKLSLEAVSKKLLVAGMTRRLSPTGFLALKGVLGLGSLALGFLVAGSFLFALLAGLALFFGPDIFLMMKARRRKEDARIQLPDALDILAVSVEAGLAFDGAITKLVEHMDGALSEEFSLTLGEMRIGRSRHEALKNLAERLDTPEIANFARAIIQADQLGISLGKLLRVQAADTRNRRQSAAEEKAMKAPIKMIVPTAIFIFPAIFLVALGPAFINIGEIF